MALSAWIRSWKRSIERRWELYNTLRRKNAARSLANRPRLEALEDRCLLSTYIVINTADSGTGSLRDAINSANNTTNGITEIDFNIGTKGTNSGVQTISPGLNNALPALTANGVFINGYSENQWQGVSSTSPLIELSGATAGNVDGLDLTGTNNTVSGLYITGFNIGIELGAANNVIGGTTAGSGNVISESTSYGVRIDGSGTNNLIQGNYVGTDVTGTSAQPNDYGFFIQGSGNTIGGTASGAGNVISGNSAFGVYLNAAGTLLQGNYIGTNATGTGALANSIGLDLASGGNTINGGNVISGNSSSGVFIEAADVSVQGNYIGTDHTGTKAIANAIGVVVNSSSVTVGGTTSGAGNIISGNSSDGISITTSNVAVQGDYIGTDLTGVNPLGNGGNGINIAGNSNTVGAGNIISANSKNGVLVSSGSGNTITQNSIFANTGLGISVASGANNSIVAPTISSASITGYALTVKGSFTAATANVPYVLEFFGNTSSDTEGKAFIGSLTVTPTSTGTQNFTFNTTTAVPRFYPLVTATLTDNSGDTSAFSNGISSTTIYLVTSAADSTSTGTLRDAITQANNTSSGITTIDFAIGKLGSAQKISLTSALPTLTANGVFINGLSQGGLGSTTQLITLDGTSAGSSSNGLLLQGASGVVSGLILEHFSDGIKVTGANNTIGGTLAGEGNVLSGNTTDGLLISSGVSGVQVQGNLIGTDVTGATALANKNGIEVAGKGNTIGGTSSGARNVISGNTTDGVLIDNGATGNLVQGNYIGTNSAGNAKLPNHNGIEVAGNSNTIGGTTSGAGNVISGNSYGVFTDSTASGILVQGNYIGTDSTGVNPLGNSGNGINIGGNSNTVGAGNIIANNQYGVRVSSGSGNKFTQNSIFANTTLGISLASGANNNITAPTISSASNTGYTLSVNGSFTAATANVPYVLEFFGNTNSDTEGKAFIGSLTVTPTSTGTQNFTFNTTTLVPRFYPLVTATLTDNSGDSSPFSNGVSTGKIYVVSSAADDGSAGTLRYAITQANNTSNGINTIDFAIGTSGIAQTISLTSALPALTTNGVFINGLSQGGLGNTTQLITLDGTSAGTGSNGLLLQGAGGVVSGFILEHFSDGIKVTGANNTIGGTTTGEGNVLSGNTTDGLLIAGASGVQVQGNLIGTDVTGTTPVANKVGIEVAGKNNTIGGTISGARNVISGNTSEGIVTDSGATGNQVLGNFIGTSANGTSPAPIINFPSGFASSGSFFTYNGGAKLNGNNLELCDGGGSEARSLFTTSQVDITHFISKWSFQITPAGSSTADGFTFCIQTVGNTALGGGGGSLGYQGIGSSIAIKFDLYNNSGEGTDSTGLYTDGASPTVPSIDLTPTGINLHSGDVINVSMTYDGTTLTVTENDPTAKASATQSYTIDIAKTVGSNKAFIGFTGGTGGLTSTQQILNWTYATQPSVGNGIGILVNAANNTFGGTAAGAGNVISGNNSNGIELAASGVTVQGNYIGTDLTGTMAASNSIGILVLAGNNTIGGTTTGASNVISGNTGDGIRTAYGISGVVVQGNYIGTDVTGTKSVANSIGVEVFNGGNDTIGGSVAAARNVISGNTRNGVLIDSAASGVQVQGNYIGTTSAGNVALANKVGVEVAGKTNTIGGTSSVAVNVISGNTADGVVLDGGTTGNLVEGNYVGTDATGTTAVANGIGILANATNNTIGGTATGAGNVVSGNNSNGIELAATGVTVQGNYIGTDLTGAKAVANSIGILVLAGNNTIGGTTAGAGNVISGNKSDGIRTAYGISGVVVQGNYIGTDVTGTKSVANSIGVEVFNGSKDTIGGTSSGAGNVISGNTTEGVLIDSSASGVSVQGNYIGTDVTGTIAVANSIGVQIAGNSNTVGGSVSGAANIISGNSKNGVLVSGGSGNTISQNSIFANTGAGIVLTNNSNNKITAPTLSSATLSSGTLTVTGTYTAPTANVTYVLEFFANVSGDPEGKIYLGSLTVTPTSTGSQSFTFNTTNTSQLGTNPLITATLTDNLGDTSAFSAGETVTG